MCDYIPGLGCNLQHIQWIQGSSVAHLLARGFSREGFHVNIKCYLISTPYYTCYIILSSLGHFRKFD